MNTELLNTFFVKSGLEVESNPRDFSDFPVCPWIKKTNMKPLVFNGSTAIGYYSEDDLPNGIKYIEELKNKWVEYMLLFKTNGALPYFGSTGDFGERMLTHIKDGRSEIRELYNLMRSEEKFIIKALRVFDNEKECRDSEKEDTKLYREIIGEIVYRQSIYNYMEMERREKIKPYMLNIKVG